VGSSSSSQPASSQQWVYWQQIVTGSSPTTVPIASTDDGVHSPVTVGSANRIEAGLSKQLSVPERPRVSVPAQSASENNSSAAEH
jgi:hypothetical protein